MEGKFLLDNPENNETQGVPNKLDTACFLKIKLK